MTLHREPRGRWRLTIGRRGWLLDWGWVTTLYDCDYELRDEPYERWCVWIARPSPRHTIYLLKGPRHPATD